MNSTLWSSTASTGCGASRPLFSGCGASRPLFNGNQPPARRPTDSHGEAQAALGFRRGSRLSALVVAGLVAALFVAFAPNGHADTSLASQSLALVNQVR